MYDCVCALKKIIYGFCFFYVHKFYSNYILKDCCVLGKKAPLPPPASKFNDFSEQVLFA